MDYQLRAIPMAGFRGSVALGLIALGCGGVEPTIRPQSASDRPAVPQITAERLQACVKEYGHQLDGGSWAFSPKLQVDRDGYVVDAYAGEVPKTAPDLAACTRDTMRSMAIPGWPFNLPQLQSVASNNEATVVQRSQLGSPAVVVVVVVEVALAELVLEAGAFTVVFAATVQIVDKVGKDIAEAARRRRKPNKNRCLDAAAGGVALWEEFCRDAGGAGGCWSKTYESEQIKRGWCNEYFGWW